MSLVQVQSIDIPDGHLSIVNNFMSPTDITCYSDIGSRQKYTAKWREVYKIFSFNTAGVYQVWDCQISNQAWGLMGVFRVWGDDTHGGSELSNCHWCNWIIDQGGVSVIVDDAWQFKYRWPQKQIQHQFATPPPAT